MPGEWNFVFKYDKKESLKVKEYQQTLMKIREEFEPKFAAMNPQEGKAEWTSKTDGTAPEDNMFGKFTYICCKAHLPKGPAHGTWTLLWNPKKADVKNHLHARCAPALFKELSNQIQTKLKNEFPDVFELTWNNGQSGYDNVTGGGAARREAMMLRNLLRMIHHMHLAEQWEDDSDRCLHHLPWSYCEECSGDILEMFGYE